MRIRACYAALACAALALGGAVPAVAGDQLLHSFRGGTDGDEPFGEPQLVRNPAGQLFGTAQNGSTSTTGNGLVFSLTAAASGSGAWNKNTLYYFGGGSSGGGDGALPDDGLVLGKNRALFGMTNRGGASSGCGTVFELTPPSLAGQKLWNEAVLYRFSPNDNFSDGCGPFFTRPLLAANGSIYGTTEGGGGSGFIGTLFRLDPPPAGAALWTETILHRFGPSGSDGTEPTGTLVQDSAGNVYGTAQTGGTHGQGTVWEYIPPANAPPYGGYQTLYNFTGGSDGGGPLGGLAGPLNSGITADIEFYGTAALGGAGCPVIVSGVTCGTVFSLSRLLVVGSSFSFAVLHNFTGGTDGQWPTAGLMVDNGGRLWGTTSYGGSSNCTDGCGTLFSLTRNSVPFGPRWNYAQTYAFTGAPTDGEGPEGGLVEDPNGHFYGTTQLGGTSKAFSFGAGTVFEFTP
jgi:hypothetical protein